jgi:hypothetical protein
VIERETGLEQIAETGVMIHGDLSADLLRTIFSPKSPLHDGAVIVRGSRVIAAGALLPLGETTIHSERFGTRHRAALGTTEQTDALVVVVSEENGQVSLVQRARIVRNLSESQLKRSLLSLLEPGGDRPGGRAPRLADIGRAVRAGRRDSTRPIEPMPPSEPMLADPPVADASPTPPAPATSGSAPVEPSTTDVAPKARRKAGVPAGTRGGPGG